jgi:hypothetical protein
MSNSKDTEPKAITIVKKVEITPPGYEIVLTTEQAVELAKFVESPTFKILENVFVRQRMDHIARQNLNTSQGVEQLFYSKGMAAELKLFFKTMKGIQKAINDPEKDEKEK